MVHRVPCSYRWGQDFENQNHEGEGEKGLEEVKEDPPSQVSRVF